MTIIRPVDREFWWDVARACEHATFFHTPLWHLLIASSLEGHRDITSGVRLADGTRAVLPLIEDATPRSRLPIRYSTFAGCYGGVIADGPIGRDVVNLMLRDAASWRINKLKLLGSPLAPAIDLPSSFLRIRDDVTHILRLSNDYEAVFSGFTQGHKKGIRKGRRMGVAVRVADTLEDYRRYYGIYEDVLRLWGGKATSRYPWALFENGFELSKEHPENIKLWIAETGARVIGGAWIFYWRRHAAGWHGVVLEDFRSHNPSLVLQDAIIRHACENAYRYYDLNPSGGHEGVIRFKRRLGAEEWPLVRFEYRGPLTRWAHRLSAAWRDPATA